MGKAKMKFGVWLPSFAWPQDNTWEPAHYLKEWCVKADHAGVDIWVIDHLLVAPGLYGGSWLEPMEMLTYAAAVTRNVKLAPGILVLPVRNPVLLAKEIATIQVLSSNRFELGAGPGWHKQEYDVTGTRIEERGRRTDEILDAVKELLEKPIASYHGKHYHFDEVSIQPHIGTMPPVWVAGGARVPDPTDDPDIHDTYGYIHPSVVKRILKHKNWLSRCSGTQEWLIRDWGLIREECKKAGGNPDELVFGHCNFTHLTPFKKREDALAVQQPYFVRAMGERRSYEHLQECYMLGTTSEIIERLEGLAENGCTYMVLGPVSSDPYQIDTLINEIVPHFS
ncbi:MAG TPA: LLM class flavin-dependent oxidoreductase [Symbiobacteriaceae bacterium]|nr:LLM class flavin-dependent oxidoreductase [Symbiobacteriaceae bacterium]